MIHKAIWGGIKTAFSGAAQEFLKPRRQGPDAMPGNPQGGVRTFHNLRNGNGQVVTPPPPIVMNGTGGRYPVVETRGWKGGAQRFFPGGETGLEIQMPANVGTQKGYHLNKSSYFLLDGTYVPKGSRLVKNRRRNPLNPRALRNAIGRIDAGKIWQDKLADISTSKFTAAGHRKSCPS